jgi:hypothetical protein
MTTPQSVLYSIDDKVRRIDNMLQGDEDNGNLVERLNEIEIQQMDVISSQQRLENLMNLIVKLLGSKTS